ncbi:site-specific recombinase, phage integrase family [Acetobacteraceae bacterium AT-5844]|nr:site-specific recombinase, phage integrase family [Acetobacteraceae bacterium AT-5844]
MAKALRLLDATGFRMMEGLNLVGERVDPVRRQITLHNQDPEAPGGGLEDPGGDATPILMETPAEGRLFRPYLNFSSNVAQVMRRIEAEERLEGRAFRRFRVHDLRHRFAVRWLKAGGTIYRLSAHLGHTSVKTTEIYLDHLTDEESEVAQKGAQREESYAL